MDNRKQTEGDPLQIVLDNTPAGVYACDVNTYEIVFTNKMLRSAYSQQLEGRKCWEVLSKFDGPCPYCKLHEVLKKPIGSVYQWENYNPEYDRWLQMHDSIVKWADGRLVHLITINDISNVKNNELKLNEYKEELEELLLEKTEKERRLQSVSDNMPNTFTFQLRRVKGGSPVLLYVSGGLATICGIKVEEMEGNLERFYRNLSQEDVERLNKMLLKGESFRMEMRYTRPDTGQLVWLDLSEIPRMNATGEIVWDGTAVDITPYKLLEQQLVEARNKAEESNKMKSVFMTRMSHEVKTPMNAILGFLDLLALEEEPSTRQDYMRIVTDNANQMLNLIEELLDVSKIDTGQMKIIPEEGNLDVLLHDIHASFMASGSLKGKPVELRISQEQGGDGTFAMDYVRLRQILNNLIGNAIKFTDQGHVKYGYRVTDEGLYFFVEDTGIGIPEDQMKNLGKPFQQVHDPKKASKYGGTGIGLAISIELVKLMGGRFWVDSEPGKGSAFQFVIPAQKFCNTLLSEE